MKNSVYVGLNEVIADSIKDFARVDLPMQICHIFKTFGNVQLQSFEIFGIIRCFDENASHHLINVALHEMVDNQLMCHKVGNRLLWSLNQSRWDQVLPCRILRPTIQMCLHERLFNEFGVHFKHTGFDLSIESPLSWNDKRRIREQHRDPVASFQNTGKAIEADQEVIASLFDGCTVVKGSTSRQMCRLDQLLVHFKVFGGNPFALDELFASLSALDPNPIEKDVLHSVLMSYPDKIGYIRLGAERYFYGLPHLLQIFSLKDRKMCEHMATTLKSAGWAHDYPARDYTVFTGSDGRTVLVDSKPLQLNEGVIQQFSDQIEQRQQEEMGVGREHGEFNIYLDDTTYGRHVYGNEELEESDSDISEPTVEGSAEDDMMVTDTLVSVDRRTSSTSKQNLVEFNEQQWQEEFTNSMMTIGSNTTRRHGLDKRKLEWKVEKDQEDEFADDNGDWKFSDRMSMVLETFEHFGRDLTLEEIIRGMRNLFGEQSVPSSMEVQDLLEESNILMDSERFQVQSWYVPEWVSVKYNEFRALVAPKDESQSVGSIGARLGKTRNPSARKVGRRYRSRSSTSKADGESSKSASSSSSSSRTVKKAMSLKQRKELRT
eukprot:TRINITY_DN4381_c1_g1_i1.p1 TRINITY_DN4381_c1_g1~~TRINITY_DN4381_c1_g1_i1.p1  ORF type:complete len:603 (-),score=189.84 TRINITY_DN4381_c1_g1_i1:42-1850(-)